MPPITQYDDYDSCLYENNDGHGVFCLSYTEVVPNNNSQIWKAIEKYSYNSKQKYRYRHDVIFIGTCIERCKSLAATMDPSQFNQFYIGSTLNKEVATIHAGNHSANYREKYDELINKCLNHEYQNKYGLQLRSNIEYCIDSRKPQGYDTADKSFIFFVVCIIFSCIVSTCYDFYLKSKEPLDSQAKFYEIKLTSKFQKLLTSFSLKRNYFKLTETQYRGTDDLKFFNGLKVVGHFLNTYGHFVGSQGGFPVSNSHYCEDRARRTMVPITIHGVVNMNSIFLLMSGFMLFYNFKNRLNINNKSSWNHCFKVIVKAIFYRYLR
ncbi:uncharacterized protein LOC119674358 [Teleopsis dalmanni]|uniref:uncharacterized protein LOC119674358 n=1 Tax=Teleopsis dalmanni TaxID=139649 RepID=UPI0018CEA503|nr:uncharacterized protein LOC119674358 [Teleopsis dalmanni]